MNKLLVLLLFVLPACALQPAETLVCYDELDRKSYILEFDPAGQKVTVKESADEFACKPGMDVYCTISTGEFKERAGSWEFSWIRTALNDEPTRLDVHKTDLDYVGEYAGALWQGQCER